MSGQTHYCVVAAGYTFDFCHAEPFLNAVTAGFVERFISVNVKIDFIIGQFINFYMSNIGFRDAFF